jgi:phosphoribosylformimino-5-aminoimidazole carboxamide ribotide isomerase
MDDNMKFRPCIDLHKGKVKQIVGSTLSDFNDRKTIVNFETDKPPSFFASMYKEDNLKGGHVIMLGPGNKNAAKQALSAFPGGLHVGGGITPDNAFEFLNAGASHVIITSYVFRKGEINWKNLKKCVNKIGKKQLILDLSCTLKNGEYLITTDRWQNHTNVSISKDNLENLSNTCDEFLIHAVDKEGKQKGVDRKLIRLLADHSPIKTTYAGGVKTMDDIEDIFKYGNCRIDFTVGSALDIFGGNLSYSSVVSRIKAEIKPSRK